MTRSRIRSLSHRAVNEGIWSHFGCSGQNSTDSDSSYQRSTFISSCTFQDWQVKSAYEPSGPPGQSLSQFLQHEVTRSISTPLPQLDGMLFHRRVTVLTPSIKFAGTHLYTWVERGTVRVECLAQEHNTMSLARARTRTARSRDERTDHEATAPPYFLGCTQEKN